jgi:hypothetical protein
MKIIYKLITFKILYIYILVFGFIAKKTGTEREGGRPPFVCGYASSPELCIDFIFSRIRG